MIYSILFSIRFSVFSVWLNQVFDHSWLPFTCWWTLSYDCFTSSTYGFVSVIFSSPSVTSTAMPTSIVTCSACPFVKLWSYFAGESSVWPTWEAIGFVSNSGAAETSGISSTFCFLADDNCYISSNYSSAWPSTYYWCVLFLLS